VKLGDEYPLSARWYGYRPAREAWKLTLTQVLALRRLRDGMQQGEAAIDMGVPRHVVETALRTARLAHNVKRTSELLALPVVLSQLEDDT